MPLGNTLSEAKSKELITILAHPGTNQGALKEINSWVKDSMNFIKKHKKNNKIEIFNLPGRLRDYEVSGIEIYNPEASLWIPGLIPRFANTKARKFQEDMARWGLDIGAIASSDGHSLKELGRNYTELTLPRFEHLNSKYLVSYYLKKAVSSATKFRGKRQSARFEAIEHIVSLAYYIARDKLQI
jgi:hypothetical protein